jgi:hypothetical protein
MYTWHTTVLTDKMEMERLQDMRKGSNSFGKCYKKPPNHSSFQDPVSVQYQQQNLRSFQPPQPPQQPNNLSMTEPIPISIPSSSFAYTLPDGGLSATATTIPFDLEGHRPFRHQPHPCSSVDMQFAQSSFPDYPHHYQQQQQQQQTRKTGCAEILMMLLVLSLIGLVVFSIYLGSIQQDTTTKTSTPTNTKPPQKPVSLEDLKQMIDSLDTRLQTIAQFMEEIRNQTKLFIPVSPTPPSPK